MHDEACIFNLFQSRAEVKDEWSYTTVLPRAFMACTATTLHSTLKIIFQVTQLKSKIIYEVYIKDLYYTGRFVARLLAAEEKTSLPNGYHGIVQPCSVSH
jgi:hypothetical protein